MDILQHSVFTGGLKSCCLSSVFVHSCYGLVLSKRLVLRASTTVFIYMDCLMCSNFVMTQNIDDIARMNS